MHPVLLPVRRDGDRVRNRERYRRTCPSVSGRPRRVRGLFLPGGVRIRVLSSLVPFVSLVALPAGAQVVSRVEIQVRSSATGDPIPAASILSPESGEVSVTDMSGKAVFRGIAPGRYLLQVRALGYEDGAIEVEAVNGRNAYASVSLVPEPLEVRGFQIGSAPSDLPSGGFQLIPGELGPTVVDLPDALGVLPGVTVVRRGGEGSPSGVQIRGSSPGQALVLLDGVPLNSPLTGEVDLSTIDLASLDRIVVVPGAQSSRYGARALGGVVLLESRGVEESTVDLSLRAGSWGGRGVSGGGSWAPSPAWALSARGDWSRADGDFPYDVPDFRGGGQGVRENAGFDRFGGHLAAERRSASVISSLRIHLSDLERGSPGPSAQPALFGEQTHRRSGTSFRIEVGDSEAGGSGLLALQWQRSEYSDSLPPFGQAYREQAKVSQREIGLEGWRRLGSIRVRAGAEFRGREIRADALTPHSTDIRDGGVWGQIEANRVIGQGGLGQLILGLRLDHHDLVGEDQLSPSLSASYEVRGTRAELAYRNAFAPPALADLFFQEGVLVRPNPDLGPERVKGEIGATLDNRLRLGRSRIHTRLSAYQANIDDMILWYPDFQFVWGPENLDVSRRGVEVGSTVDLPALGHEHRFSGRAAWTHVEYRGSVLRGQVAYRPVFSASAEGRFGLPLGNLTLSANHVGIRRSVPGSDLNSLSPYTTVNLGWSSAIGLGRVSGSLDLLLSNLLDERAALLVDYPLPSRGWSVRIHLAPRKRP